MPTKKVIIIGGTGNGSVIAAAIEDAASRDQSDLQVAGYLNDRVPAGDQIEAHLVLGGLQDVPRFLDEGYYFINTIYRIDGQDRRIDLFDGLNIPADRLATFVHPLAYVAPGVEIGAGTVIMPQVAVSPGVRFGKCCLVMVNATVGHNNRIGDHCHFAAQSCLGSFLKIEDGVHIGLNATVRENLTLGCCSTLAMGAVLLNDMKPYEIWAGVPAKFLRLANRESET